MPIALRGHLHLLPRQSRRSPGKRIAPLGPSEYALIFDTETRTDNAQQLRLGAYQVRHSGDIIEVGFFYDPRTLSTAEVATLTAFASERGQQVLTVADFVELVFYPVAWELRGTVVGFNLPFDISRLAIRHSTAKSKKMRGGFNFTFSPNERYPQVQVKHLTRRAASICFAALSRNRTGRGMLKRRLVLPTRRGFFVDVRTAAGAILGGSLTLETLSKRLQVPHPKLNSDNHGGPLTTEYLAYAERDAQTTWECYVRLCERYGAYQLTATPIYRIYSEAGIGKAYLTEMGIRPWRTIQPEVDPGLIGRIVSSYYGGRSEVHTRREVRQIAYCDFLSMYPTVCTLMNLWRFVIARGFDCVDATEKTRQLLANISLDRLQHAEFWKELPVLVQTDPDDDLYPVRGKYGRDGQYTIGLNHLSSKWRLWFTLADCVAAKLLTGKAPSVQRAVRFIPREPQSGLKPIAIAGNPEYRIDPYKDDFYRRLIERRAEVKNHMGAANPEQLARLDAEQHNIKITANSAGYGIFFELNVTEESKPVKSQCFGPDGDGFGVSVKQTEEPGRYFHPLLATLITGAARLMLAITERLTIDHGLDWVFCDTDSMAIAKPDGMTDAAFWRSIENIRDFFRPLNPYGDPAREEPVLKLEDANFELINGRRGRALVPLYAFAIAPKRYVLFNLDSEGRPVIRKASAHGLGHLRPPYGSDSQLPSIPAPALELEKIGVERWQHDVWYRIIVATLAGHPEQVALADLRNFNQPAVSRYAATTPALLRWFKRYNKGKPYHEQVRPFGFLLAFQGKRLDDVWTALDAPAAKTKRDTAKALLNAPRAVAPFDRDPAKAAEQCFDRATGEHVHRNRLKTYSEALLRYHLHPDPKAGRANYMDRGATKRRHIHATAVQLIGKEANRWEEQFHLGADPQAQSEFGFQPEDREAMLEAIRGAARRHGVQALAHAVGLSRQHVTDMVKGKSSGTDSTIADLATTAAALDASEQQAAAQTEQLMMLVRQRCAAIGMRAFARITGVGSGNLSRLLTGRRAPGEETVARLAQALRVKVDGPPSISRSPRPTSPNPPAVTGVPPADGSAD